MLWHLQHNRALHRFVVVLSIIMETKPRVPVLERLVVVREGENFWRVTAHIGFMQRPDIPRILGQACERGCDIRLDDVTYYVGHEIILHRERGADLPAWQEAMFAAMVRNATHVTDYFQLPSDSVVEIGRHIAI
jgi:KUP system potassium uptake protein